MNARTKSRIALVQMTSSKFVDKNLGRVSEMIREAAMQDVAAIFLPENFAALASDDPRAIGMAEDGVRGLIGSVIADLARETSTWIFAGTIPSGVRPDGEAVTDARVRAASVVFNAQGERVARYDKMHMFDVDVPDNQKKYLESATFEPGEDLVCVSSPLGPVGLSVCYDIRFPELYRRLASIGSLSFAIPSAFTRVTGAAHFEVLMRARAIENFAFTIAACQAGSHDSGRETYGHSMVVDPWGNTLCRGGDGEEILLAELDFNELERIRRDMPVHEQRRLPDA